MTFWKNGDSRRLLATLFALRPLDRRNREIKRHDFEVAKHVAPKIHSNEERTIYGNSRRLTLEGTEECGAIFLRKHFVVCKVNSNVCAADPQADIIWSGFLNVKTSILSPPFSGVQGATGFMRPRCTTYSTLPHTT